MQQSKNFNPRHIIGETIKSILSVRSDVLVFDSPHAFLSFGGERIGLDAKAQTTFISHAHLDHYVSTGKCTTILSSQATLDLLKARKKKAPERAVESHENGAQVRLLDAGHVLGSRMLFAENEKTFLYTGDFLSQDSLTQKGAKPVDTDVMVVECTYGLPQYAFPSRWEIYDKIGEYAKEGLESGSNVVLGAYSLGKAQEVIKALNQKGISPVCPESVTSINEVYRRYGVSMDALHAESPEGIEALSKPFVAVLPMHRVNRAMREELKNAYGRKVKTAVATGWAQDMRSTVEEAFCLSDHNDFPNLVSFIQACNPEKVYTTHGPADVFAAHLCREGLDALPLEFLSEKQKTLEGF